MILRAPVVVVARRRHILGMLRAILSPRCSRVALGQCGKTAGGAKVRIDDANHGAVGADAQPRARIATERIRDTCAGAEGESEILEEVHVTSPG